MGVNINSSGFFSLPDWTSQATFTCSVLGWQHVISPICRNRSHCYSVEMIFWFEIHFFGNLYGRIDSYLGGWKSNAVFLGSAGKYKAFREDFASVQKYTQEMCLGFIDAGLSQWMWDILYNNIHGQNQTYFVGYHLDPMVRRCCSRPLGLGILYCQAHAVQKWLARCVDQR